MFNVTNVSNTLVVVSDYHLEPHVEHSILYLTNNLVGLYAIGTLNITPAPEVLESTMLVLTDNGGGIPDTDGIIETVPLVYDAAPVANNISTLVVETEKSRRDIANTLARVSDMTEQLRHLEEKIGKF